MRMDLDTLREVIAQAQTGQAGGLERLLETYGRRLYGYFYRATGDHHEAEDLLAEMTLRLMRTIGGYSDQGRFEPWLFRIACNMVRDRIRRRTSQGVTHSLSGGNDGNPLGDDLPGASEPVSLRLEQAELSQRLEQALGRLDETSRQMILLRHFGDMSFKEIADVFDCPLGTALAKVHRGLKTLRQWMGDEQ